jgi:predicted GIY-YIG superfamily endonuclease
MDAKSSKIRALKRDCLTNPYQSKLYYVGGHLLFLLIFAERYLEGCRDFVRLVEHNAKKAIDAGTEPAQAYQWAMTGSLQLVEEKANEQRAARDALSPPGEAVDGKLTLTLGQLLDSRTSGGAKLKRRNMLAGVTRNVVYVVRDGDAVLYVGCTRGEARSRLREHIAGRSPLGLAIRRERQRSKGWTAEMISHADHKSALATEKRLTEEYRPRYCAAYAKSGESTTWQEPCRT